MSQEPIISAHEDPEGESPWALQCVVKDTKDFTHRQLAHALAVAVVSYLDTVEKDTERSKAVERWMAGRIRKLLRRAKNAGWEAVQAEDGETYEVDGVTIRVFTPTAMDSIPKSISKCQVAHLTSLDDSSSTYGSLSPCLKIYTNRSLNMSAAKAAVAAAHVAHIMSIRLTDEDYFLWKESGFALSVSSLGEVSDFIDSVADVSIHDGGLTEVEPGSITAVGFWKGNEHSIS